MKIAHSADWHIGELKGPTVHGENARLLDTVKCLDYMVDEVRRFQPALKVVAGDVFHKSKLWGDQLVKEVLLVANALREMGKVCPTVVVQGTKDHDSDASFKLLKEMQIRNVWIVMAPEVIRFGPVQVACMPGYDKAMFRALSPGMRPEEENEVCSVMLSGMLRELKMQVRPSDGPTILVAHYGIDGGRLDSGTEATSQSDVLLHPGVLQELGFDLVCLGHWHRKHQVKWSGGTVPVFFSGSLNGVTFNEEAQKKGFLVHDTADIKDPHFVITPYRRYVTMEMDDSDIQNFINGETYSWFDDQDPWFPDITDCIVRVHYECTEENEKLLNRNNLMRYLYDNGAFYISEVTPKQIIQEQAKDSLNENADPIQNLRGWCSYSEIPEEETEALVELAVPMVATVEARRPTGKIGGTFELIEQTVRNYRAYANETFDFRNVSFAAICGLNGKGKSSFFMDSIVDGLFEPTGKSASRSGVTGGWITTGKDEGMIQTVFRMGETIWRVTRARSIKGNGKLSLTLDQMVEGKWETASKGLSASVVQKKIVDVLGMDADTFRCVCMVMQDDYARFLEADKSERMAVLAAILGLGIYDDLRELADKKRKETSDELLVVKAHVEQLKKEVERLPGLLEELVKANQDLEQVNGQIAQAEADLQAAEDELRKLQAQAERSEELQRQMTAIDAEIRKKLAERQEQEQRKKEAEDKLSHEPAILAKCSELEKVKAQVIELKAKIPVLQEKEREFSRLTTDLITVDRNITQVAGQIQKTEKELASKNELENATKEYREAVNSMNGMDDLEQKWADLNFKVHQANIEWGRAHVKLSSEKSSLQQTINNCERRVALLENSGCIDPENAKCGYLADSHKAKAELAEAQQKLSMLDEEAVKTLEQKYLDMEAERDALGYDAQRHRELKQKINELRPKAELLAQFSGKEELLTTLKARHEELQAQADVLTKQCQEAKQVIQLLKKETAPLAELERKIPNLEGWAKLKDSIPALRETVKNAEESMQRIDIEQFEKLNQKESLQTEIDQLKSASKNSFIAKDRVDMLRKLLNDTLRNNERRLLGIIGGLQSQITTLQQKEVSLSEKQIELSPLAQKLTRLERLKEAFSATGIPHRIIRAAIPELNARANDRLIRMTGGRMTIAVKPDREQKNGKEVPAIEVFVSDWGSERPYKDYSGGEKVRAALSMVFGLSGLVSSRGAIQSNFLGIDEPPFLDAEGVDAYIEAVTMEFESRPGLKVMAISHDPLFRERFPQKVEVYRDETGARVRVVA
ncbi:AAA family ATPase [Heliobacterium chlorum]|uniref:Nuclease SbcCD subunit C n=1 Tax=Heliobacterium chlorum TaxID=2698 RepID=A0ABR7T0Q4_HELCL|nr:AAA family ATPase [Heliobacterium chlorum]MBC9783505.1 AAA family ATPase [Heliobacterium chlorum]